jgi:hypothetical protein
MKTIFLILLIAFPVFADGNMGNGANIFPISHKQIQLVQESIRLTYGGEWFVEMTGSYKNLGPETTVQIGFPSDQTLPYNYEEMSSKKPSERKYEIDYFDPEFKTYVNGKSIPVMAKRGWDYPELEKVDAPTIFTFDVHFNKGEVKTIKNSYVAGGYTSSLADYKFQYNLSYGALWKDKIDLLKIEMRLPSQSKGFDFISPQEQSCTIDDSSHQIVLRWRYSDIDPDFNIEVSDLSWRDRSNTLDQYIEFADLFIKEHGETGIRYLRNLLYAHYGYPFKNPFIRAKFYSSGRYSENENFSEDMISSRHKEFLKKLEAMEREYQ